MDKHDMMHELMMMIAHQAPLDALRGGMPELNRSIESARKTLAELEEAKAIMVKRFPELDTPDDFEQQLNALLPKPEAAE